MNTELRRPEVAATQEGAGQRRGSSTSLPPGTLPKVLEAQRAVMGRYPRMHPATALRIALKATGALALVSQLSGCFFVFIPGSLIEKVADAPKYCVAGGAQVGQTFTLEGKTLVITKVKGQSPYFCRNAPEGKRLGVDGREA